MACAAVTEPAHPTNAGRDDLFVVVCPPPPAHIIRDLRWHASRRWSSDLHQLLSGRPRLCTSQRTDEVVGQVDGQLEAVRADSIAQVVQFELESIHDAKHRSIRRLRIARLGHGPSLGCDELSVHTQDPEDGLQRPGDALSELRGRRQWEENGQQRRFIDQEGHLWSPEDDSGVPVSQGRRGLSSTGTTGCFTRSSSFFVPWMVYTGTSVPAPWDVQLNDRHGEFDGGLADPPEISPAPERLRPQLINATPD